MGRFGLGQVFAGIVVGWLGFGAWLITAPVGRVVAAADFPAATSGALPNEACAGCHREIYERYRTTPMARASGPAIDGFLPGSFRHEASGVQYRMEKSKGQVYLDFERVPSVSGELGASASNAFSGRRELKYFLGSGNRGRTFLFEQDGYWFEIPINWYAKKQIWDMAPNYQSASEMPLTLPVDPGCLRCHASGAQASLPEARNKYAGAPFTVGGITCTSCHGDAAAHLASGGRVALPNIDALEPVKRDSICLSCHLEGEAAVIHLGKRLVDFKPGESVFDYVSYFVREATISGGERATSQWEALLQSGCRRGAGSRLTCTSCHDPHGDPNSSTAAMTAGERVEFYRARCLACHDGPTSQNRATGPAGFGASHHPENRDCAACHMPRAASNDIAHEQVTDHSIPRLRSGGKAASAAGSALVLVGDGTGEIRSQTPGEIRDLGLAYAMRAVKGDRAAGERAMELLKEAEAAPGADADSELHGQLGFLKQLSGDGVGAAAEYESALRANPDDSFAAGNLALLKASQKQYRAAMDLWGRAFFDDPVQLKAGMNLAIVQCGVGEREAALGTLDRILSFSPDDGAAREMARRIRSSKTGCGKP